MLSSTAGEGADAYSVDPWEAFKKDDGNLTRLKAGLTALMDAIDRDKISFKHSVNRKVTERQGSVCEKGELDEYRRQFGDLESRQNQLQAAVSVDDRRELEKSLDRAKWEHRDVTAEITHSREQITRISTQLRKLRTRLEGSLSRLVRDEIVVEFSSELQAVLAEEAREES